MNNNINEILNEALNNLQKAGLEDIENIKDAKYDKKGTMTKLIQTH